MIRLYNARILTKELEILEGEVWVDGSEIIFVGTEAEARLAKTNQKPVWQQQIDCERNLLLPGFKNAHTHSPMVFLRSYADDLPLSKWLNQQVFPMEAKLKEEDMYDLTKLAILEYLTSGITSVFDMYLLTQPRIRAAEECGFRMVICGSVNDFTGSIKQMEEEFVSIGRPGQQKTSLISYQLGFHAEYTTKRDLLEQIADMANRHKAPVYMHLAETKEEVEQCRGRYQMSPVQFLDKIGMFDYGGGGFHCVHVDEKDMEILKQRHISVITNPASNLKLASGIAPIEKMYKMGINIALGTDGAASNNCLDMFREMFLTTALQKIYEENAAALSADKVLKMAVCNGAEAMGLMDCDCIEKGKCADLVLIDLKRPNMQPEHNLIKNLVYSASKENVKLTMVNGKILYRDREFFVGTDAEEIYARANEIICRLTHT